MKRRSSVRFHTKKKYVKSDSEDDYKDSDEENCDDDNYIEEVFIFNYFNFISCSGTENTSSIF